MWRPAMFLLCLIAALSGGPLRQAEAADDLARSLGGSESGLAVVAVDGGVGDEAEASILEAGGEDRELHAQATPATTPSGPSPRIRTSAPAEVAAPPRSRLAGSLAGSSGSRRAWLQCFVF